MASVLVFVTGLAAVVAVFFGPSLFDRGNDDGVADGPDTATTSPGTLSGADLVLAEFGEALVANDLGRLRFASSAPGIVISDFDSITEGLGPFEIEVITGDPALVGSNEAQASIQLTWSFPDTAPWITTSTVMLENQDDQWFVRWDPSVLEPSLALGDRLERRRVAPSRGDILDRDGAVLVGTVDLITIGVRPSRVQDLPLLAADLERLIQADPSDLTSRVEAAEPDAFVEITTLERSAYEQIREEIFPLPGTVFRESSLPLADDPTFARAVLGRSGEVTAEIIEANPGVFVPGEIAGLSGLQARYNRELAGRAGAEILVTRHIPDPSSTTTGTGLTTTSALAGNGEPETLAVIDPLRGESIVTTIDSEIQAAAERALDGETRTSALVVVEVSTGELVAVANGPRGSTVNFAMTGQYPPGSIFKIISGYALLDGTLQAATPVDCPQTITIDGREFANAEDEVLGTIPFATAFAHSCNTAFVGATTGFSPETLAVAATEFGIGIASEVGSPAYLGSVPVTESQVDLAASAFGQGRVLFSPLSAAVMAATAADGTYRSPRLITSPLPAEQEVTVLEPTAAATLRDLMRQVVTTGTGRAVAGVSGAPVHGKTGTAEFGNAVPPQSHAWFVGFQGNLAFAVFVEAGEFGGATAAPLAAALLEDLATPNEPAPDAGEEQPPTTETGSSTTTTEQETTTTSSTSTTPTSLPPESTSTTAG